MKTKNKALLLSLCAVLLIAASVFGTIAYLTDQEGVTNTFTVGSVGLTLDEADVKPDGTLDTDERVQANEYHLLPGHTYIKDPTVTVEANSENAYIRMIVTVKGIDQLKNALPMEGATAKYYAPDGVFLLQMLCNGWDNTVWQYECYAQSADGTIGFYEFRYQDVVDKSESETKLPALFQSITVPGEIDNTHLACLANVKIIVNAHAIQKDGFTTAGEAWIAFDGENNG